MSYLHPPSPSLSFTHLPQLSEQIAPLNQRIETKEKEKIRMRNLAEEEEKTITEALNAFNNGVGSLRDIVHSIDDYNASNSGDAADRFKKESEELALKSEEKANEYASLRPSLERLMKMVDDQERHKKNLEENIELIHSLQLTASLNKDILELNDKISRVDGRETCDDDMNRLRKQRLELSTEKARYEGRRSEIMQSIQGLKRKLSQPEYKQVDEEYRVASIKQDTTEMAVKDIEKYHAALDKALQRYHSIKIGEINGIIRDLWTLTYKGEDISNIQIVSGEESGSRATRSYNYRVVMFKGSAQMDMRGRCSAGQRVLASIVIRLALAETFCVNFGCIALDEPTVNLDYNNKRGLAIALAQIIASRSQQSNFQLILITHDEDFVLMMKNELSSHVNVSMPEKYFQVRREEGADGKFYSKIDAIDCELPTILFRFILPGYLFVVIVTQIL
jgi:DNA repair protein RAD50